MSQWKKRYGLCLRFAAFYNSEFRFDIVHNAWLRYYEKEKNDLFEIELKDENSFLYTIIKRAFFYWNYHERKGENYLYYSTDILSSKFNNPLDELVGKDLYDIFYKKLYIATEPNEKRHYRIDRQLPLEIFRLKASGYTQKEIADELNVSKVVVNQYNKKIESMSYPNPFNGSRTIVKKRLSEAAWEKRIDHNEFELEAENEWDVLYVHKESKEGWVVKIKNPVQSEFYVKRLEDSKK